jgi:TonB family protein
MPKKLVLIILAGIPVLAAALYAQDTNAWVPSKILGMIYPTLARHSRLEGDVTAKCRIREDGSVAEVEILSSPHKLLTEYVKSNLLQWQFRRTGSAVHENQITVTCSFRLSGECEDARRCKETEFWYEYPYHVIAIVDHFPLRY